MILEIMFVFWFVVILLYEISRVTKYQRIRRRLNRKEKARKKEWELTFSKMIKDMTTKQAMETLVFGEESTTRIPVPIENVTSFTLHNYVDGSEIKDIDIPLEVWVPIENKPVNIPKTFERMNVMLELQRIEEEEAERNKFMINDYITLKLEDNETNVYIGGIQFVQCKFLLINVDRANPKKYEELKDIDEAVKLYGKDLEEMSQNEKEEKFNVTPEEEFRAHCSNIQAWVENGYDTRLLHSNISFPMLKRLVEIGDQKAVNVFRDEILSRYYEGNKTVRQYLVNERYLDYLEIEQILDIVKIELLSNKCVRINVRLTDLWKAKDELVTDFTAPRSPDDYV